MKTNQPKPLPTPLSDNKLLQTLTDAESQMVKAGGICHGVSVLAWARVEGRSV